MKKVFFLFTFILIMGCDKEDIGFESLPPATQTGARTLGCLVDGKAFIHKGNVMNCYYQIIDGEHFFGIQGRNNDENPISITLGTYNKAIVEGETYQLLESVPDNAWGGSLFETTQTSGEVANTNSEFSGELTITKLDFINNIVSGTFWFDLAHPLTGETVEITQGRFDSIFTQ